MAVLFCNTKWGLVREKKKKEKKNQTFKEPFSHWVVSSEPLS